MVDKTPKTSWTDIRAKIQALVKTMGRPNPGLIKNAVRTYKDYGQLLMKTPVSGNQLLKGKDRLFPVVRRQHIGRMCMFFYDPKWANELPYYDRFPLIMPVEMYKDGFLGINFHYLPPMQRAKLLDTLIGIYGDQYMNEKKKMIMSYSILKSYVRSRLYVPCVKRYLYSHLKSRLYLIDPSDWQIAILLPTERFEKARKTRVFTESMNKVKR